MNKLDKQYTDLLKDILANGKPKTDRTGTGTISVFGRQIRHNMRDGFPLLTTKKMPFKSIAIELLWFLRGETNIKFLLENGCHIWDGDAYKHYKKWNQFSSNPKWLKPVPLDNGYFGATLYSQEEFIEMVLTNEEFSKKWGELGPIYGKQWRKWTRGTMSGPGSAAAGINAKGEYSEYFTGDMHVTYMDQIKDLITLLKTDPDSRRLMVNSWNVGELSMMVLPPCHYGFQCYTRELSYEERYDYWFAHNYETGMEKCYEIAPDFDNEYYDKTPTRALSLMWNQRSVDTFLGLPFNLASYGLLLTLLAELTGMVTEDLICNLGDTHLYLNHIEQAKEQIGRDYSFAEREAMYPNYMDIITPDMVDCTVGMGQWYIDGANGWDQFRAHISKKKILSSLGIPERTRVPFALPRLLINTEFWLTENGECGIGPLDVDWFLSSIQDEDFCTALLREDIQISGYQAHEAIKAPLSN